MVIGVKRIRLEFGRLSATACAEIFLVLSQIAFAAAVPLSLAHNYRMGYNVVKDNLADVGATLDLIAKDIRARHLDDYVILLGDSVTYSGPGGPTQSVSRHMNEVASSGGLPPVYNAAIPAAQMGDFYTLLLMLDERGISTDHVTLNLIYPGSVKRDPAGIVLNTTEDEVGA